MTGGESAAQVVKALEEEPTQGERRLGVGREPVVNRLSIALIPAGGEQPQNQPGGDLLISIGPHPLKLLEVARGERGRQPAVSVDGETRDQGVNMVVAQGCVAQKTVEDLRLELFSGPRAGGLQVAGQTAGRRVRLPLCIKLIEADGVQPRQSGQCPPPQISVKLQSRKVAVEQPSNAGDDLRCDVLTE